MSTDRKNAIIVGVLFIVAAATAMLGLASYNPVIFSPDYLIKGSEHANRMILCVLFELILACSVVGTSIMLFPYLKKQNESIGSGTCASGFSRPSSSLAVQWPCYLL